MKGENSRKIKVAATVIMVVLVIGLVIRVSNLGVYVFDRGEVDYAGGNFTVDMQVQIYDRGGGLVGGSWIDIFAPTAGAVSLPGQEDCYLGGGTWENYDCVYPEPVVSCSGFDILVENMLTGDQSCIRPSALDECRDLGNCPYEMVSGDTDLVVVPTPPITTTTRTGLPQPDEPVPTAVPDVSSVKVTITSARIEAWGIKKGLNDDRNGFRLEFKTRADSGGGWSDYIKRAKIRASDGKFQFDDISSDHWIATMKDPVSMTIDIDQLLNREGWNWDSMDFLNIKFYVHARGHRMDNGEMEDSESRDIIVMVWKRA